jgi:hypothetical protein
VPLKLSVRARDTGGARGPGWGRNRVEGDDDLVLRNPFARAAFLGRGVGTAAHLGGLGGAGGGFRRQFRGHDPDAGDAVDVLEVGGEPGNRVLAGRAANDLQRRPGDRVAYLHVGSFIDLDRRAGGSGELHEPHVLGDDQRELVEDALPVKRLWARLETVLARICSTAPNWAKALRLWASAVFVWSSWFRLATSASLWRPAGDREDDDQQQDKPESPGRRRDAAGAHLGAIATTRVRG